MSDDFYWKLLHPRTAAACLACAATFTLWVAWRIRRAHRYIAAVAGDE